MPLLLPPSYRPALDLRQTQVAIKEVKDFFEHSLSDILSLTRVTAPLLVRPDSGLNDNLNGVERPVQFDIPAISGPLSGQVEALRPRPVRL